MESDRPEDQVSPGLRMTSRRLSEFIRARKHEILTEWEVLVRGLPVAKSLERPALIDHVPELLDEIARLADNLAEGESPALSMEIAERHALDRLEEGFDLAQVVAEFSALRDCVMRLWQRESFADGVIDDLRILNHAIDRAVTASVTRYTQARDRALQALDRIANAALDSRDLDDFLKRLLAVLRDTTPAIDAASIFLVDGSTLVLRASVGLDLDPGDFGLAIGEGFAGAVAAERKPRMVENAQTDPIVRNPALRSKGIRALYGLPLVDTEHLIGVATVGSLTAKAFSEQDLRLVAAMANRATTAINQHMLRAAAERRAAELEAIIDSMPDAVFVGTHTGLTHFNRAANELFGWTDAELAMPPAELAGKVIARDATTRRPLSTEDGPFQRALAGEATTRELSVDHPKTARELVLRVAAAPIRVRGGTIGAVSISSDITERKQAERMQASLAEIFELGEACVVIDPQWRIIFVNKNQERLSGAPREQTLGRHVSEVWPELMTADSPFRSELDRVMRERTAGEIETYYAPLDLWTSSSLFPMRDGSVAVFLRDVSARKRAEAELQTAHREAEESLAVANATLSSAAVGIGFIDRDMRYVRVNEALASINGKPVEEHLGRTVREVLGNRADALKPLLAEVLATGVPKSNIEIAFPLDAPPFRQRSYLASYAPVRLATRETLGVGVAVVEITERKHAERAFQFLAEATTVLTSSLDYDATLKKTAELVVPELGDWCVIDIVDEHDRSRRLVHVEGDEDHRALAAELATRYPIDLAADSGVPAVMRSGKSVLASVVSDAQMIAGARDRRHLEITRGLGARSFIITPLIARGRTLGALTVVSSRADRTYGHRDVDLLEALAGRAAVAIDNARLLAATQQAVRQREDVIAVVSHDLRNPLNAIELASTMALPYIADGKARKHVDTINRAASRMSGLLKDLLDMASIQAGRMSFDMRSEDPLYLMTDAVDLHEPLARAKGITFHRELPASLPLVTCDRDRIAQVLGNLLGNAIKFCQTGDTVAVAARAGDGVVHFLVSDSGPGMSPEVAANVFEPYWSAREHAKQGTGLGLSISRGIVEAHGGSISVVSAPKAGATFEFTLPIAKTP